ncbi:RNI-like protein [Phellopilus nigrolimitatus]|nr:RNI-like protein [Phellopilus nigrolimitatus]
MYSHSSNNSTTSLSDNDDDEIKDLPLTVYPYYPRDVAPAQWSSSTHGERPKTPPHSPASHLPPEILIHVLRQVHSARDLHSSLLVSRAWCECAVELLWHRPSFTDLSRFVQMLQVICSEEKTFDYARFVRRLNFVYLSRDLTDSLFIWLSRCVKLERLTLVNCAELTDDALLRVLPLCSNLVALDLTNITSCTDRSIVALAQSATKLQGLNLGGCKNITDEGVVAIAFYCPLLRRIKLSNVKNITDRAVSALAKQCPLLLEIDLHGCVKVTDEAIRDIWIHLSHLRDFRLAQCSDLTDLAFPANPLTNVDTQLGVQPFPNSVAPPTEMLPPLKLSRLCEHLRMLDLTACALITDDAVAGIIANAPKIRNLYLAKCSQLTDVAVENICKLGKHLHYLHLGHASAITDRSVRTLARSCTRLRYIDLACCPLLTDMSVFELSGLPKLRRIGLVRVTNLTDQAIFSLADRHSTLERIHLSYCENITVLAVHFLLQRLAKLTHLSLTGIPAFRRPELQQFCRSPPREFNTNQRAAFCVYSGTGVDSLRIYLAELMAQVQANDDTGDNDTDYDAEEDEELPSFSDQERSVEHLVGVDAVETPRVAYAGEREWRTSAGGTVITHEEVFDDDNGYNRAILLPSTIATVRGRAVRPIAERTVTPEPRPVVVEDTNPSSVATTPSPTVQPSPTSTPGSNRLHGFGQSLIVEPPSPSPQTTYNSRPVSFPSPTYVRSSSNASDAASNRSAHSSGTNNTNTSASNGAGFFRSYIAGGRSASDAASTARGGVYTPDLVYAEIGHGRGGEGVAGPGPNTMLRAAWRSESSSSSPQDEIMHPKSEFLSLNGSDTALHGGVSGGRRHTVLVDTSNTSHLPAVERESDSSAPFIHDEHDPSSPIPYLSSSPTTKELQESVHTALAGSSSSSGIISEDALADNRGRSVRRSLKNTLNAAEQYASALFFGRNGSTSSTSATARPRASNVNGSGLAGAANGRSHPPDRH